MTIKEAATEIGCSIRTVYELCAAGHLAHRRIGVGKRKIVIDATHIRDYLDRCEVPASEPEVEAPAAHRSKGLVIPDRMSEFMRPKKTSGRA